MQFREFCLVSMKAGLCQNDLKQKYSPLRTPDRGQIMFFLTSKFFLARDLIQESDRTNVNADDPVTDQKMRKKVTKIEEKLNELLKK